MDYSPNTSRDPGRSLAFARRSGGPNKSNPCKRYLKDTIPGAAGRLQQWQHLYKEQKTFFDEYVKKEKHRLQAYKCEINFLALQIKTAKKRKMKTFYAPTFLRSKS